VSIQINFKIQLESDELGTAAVTALNNDVATGELATTFTEKAADRNEIVAVVSQILDTTCDSCGGVIESVSDINVSEATYIAVGALELSIVIVLIMMWVTMAKDNATSTKAPTENTANIRNTQILPMEQLDLENSSRDKQHTETSAVHTADRSNTTNVVETDVLEHTSRMSTTADIPNIPHFGIPTITTHLDATSNDGQPSSVVAIPILSGELGHFDELPAYHALDVVQAAALHCG
jgi:hypothetical protein